MCKKSTTTISAVQKALVIMENFTGQMTVVTIDAFKEVSIWIVSVPANMTKYYQPLDLAVHVYTKHFLNINSPNGTLMRY